MFSNGYILNPNPELKPEYRISPFRTSDVVKNRRLADSDLCDDYFHERFDNSRFIYTQSGRHSINIALSYYNLRPQDCVTIYTTSGNFYISSCVTNEIERFCKWSRKLENNTKLIFINHEFGYPYHGLMKLKELNIPIIEDCAHSFFSKDEGNTIGKIGDFVIYSLPKIFPMQLGGILVFRPYIDLKIKEEFDKQVSIYIRKILSHYIPLFENILQARNENYKLLRDKLANLGFSERFPLQDGVIPGIFMFNAGENQINLPELKLYLQRNGIECSVFYGERSFYLPCHQNLTEEDLDYFITILKDFLNKPRHEIF
jgi:hypothetical protein